MGGYLKNKVLWFKNHLLWTSLIYVEKYTATKKNRREYNTPPDEKFSFVIFRFNSNI